MKRCLILPPGQFGPLNVVAVGFIDGNGIGQFQNAFFDALQFVAAPRDHQHQKKIHHGGHGNFRLTDADGFDQNGVKSRSLTDQHGFTRFARDAAECFAGRGGPDKRPLVDGQFFHARFVRQDAAARFRRTGINRQYGDKVAFLRQQGSEAFDKRTFTRARQTCNAQSKRPARMGHQPVQDLP